MHILITDGNERAALAAARSLVRAGHAVSVAAPTSLSLAGVSRGVRPLQLATDPLRDPAAYAAEVGRIAKRDRVGLLLPMTDPSLGAVLEHPETLPVGVALPFPDLATSRAASDKADVLELARSCGFGAPDTRIIATPGECDAAVAEASFPAVVKPHRSVVTVGASRCKLAVVQVADGADCRRALAALPAGACPGALPARPGGGRGGVFGARSGGASGPSVAPLPPREKTAPPGGRVWIDGPARAQSAGF